MALKLRHANRSKPTLQKHHQLNTKSRATALENHVLCVTRTASDRQQIAKYKSAFNFKSCVLRSFIFIKFKMQYSTRRAAYLSPQTVRRSSEYVVLDILATADRFLVVQMYLWDIVTFKTLKPISLHSSILEHISFSFEGYFDQRWSEKN